MQENKKTAHLLCMEESSSFVRIAVVRCREQSIFVCNPLLRYKYVESTMAVLVNQASTLFQLRLSVRARWIVVIHFVACMIQLKVETAIDFVWNCGIIKIILCGITVFYLISSSVMAFTFGVLPSAEVSMVSSPAFRSSTAFS